MDGERLVRFGAVEPALLAERGFDRYALLTTPRAELRALAEGAATVAYVPAGPVPDAARAVFDSVGDLPVVGLGGGRVIDSAKAVAGVRGTPCAAIPTTLSGAEMTPFHRLPAGLDGRLVRPSLVLADPELMASQPPDDRRASAMNALAHAVEALYTPLRNPVATMAASRAAELIRGGLVEGEREALSLGALLAGYASGQTGFAVHHVVCQTIVRLAGTPHAQTNAAVLPHSIRLMARRAPDALGALGQALDADDPAAAVERLGRPAPLRSLGLSEGQIPGVVEQVLARPELLNTPDPPRERELAGLLEAAL